MPDMLPDVVPPTIHGTAELTHRAFAGETAERLLGFVDRPASTPGEAAARLLDRSTVLQLAFQPQQALAAQAEALSTCQLFRVAGRYSPTGPDPIRLLALMEPGDLMTNTPLDFITRSLNVRLDLLYLLPGRALPSAVPAHDVAYIGGGDNAAPAALARRASLFRHWPRPVLNDPVLVSRLARAELAASLADAPGICSPSCRILSREQVLGDLGMPFPVLIRPVGSHAGAGLVKADDAAAIRDYVQQVALPAYYVTRFEDYRSADRLFRKYRIAFVDRAPFLCHMGVSANWMIHYLNAGMTGSDDKRLDEARAMATFDTGFASRHRTALDTLCDRIGLDYFTLDCGETRDGRLLVFEADAEAIVHLMDSPDLFPYKPPQMRRVFAAFGSMLHRHAERGGPETALAA